MIRPAAQATAHEGLGAFVLPDSVRRDIARLPERARAEAELRYRETWRGHNAAQARYEARDRAGDKTPAAPYVAKKSPEPRPRMTKTEARAAAEILEPMKQRGEIARYCFEAIKLKLPADRMTYTPDFPYWFPDGRVGLLEVKGFPGWKRAYEDSWMKVKLCRQAYPEFPLTVAVWNGKTREWEMEYA